jgi:hypothetical protein
MQEPDEETIAFAHRMFDLARNGDTGRSPPTSTQACP